MSDDETEHPTWWPPFCTTCGAANPRAIMLLVVSAAVVALFLMLVFG